MKTLAAVENTLSGRNTKRPSAAATAPSMMRIWVRRMGATKTAMPVSMPMVARPNP